MRRWQIGDVEIVRVDASNFVLPTAEAMPPWAVPDFTPSQNKTPLAFSALAVRSGEHRVVVDPWLADDSPRSRPDADAAVTTLLRTLDEAGFPAGDVDFVVNTHIDGIGWNTRPSAGGWVPTFCNARYLYPADEIAAVDRGSWISGADQIVPLRDAGVLDAVEAPYALTPEITLQPASGHSYGHVAVRVESDGELAVYPGHLVLSLLQIESPDRNLGDTSYATATASRRMILDELADRRGVLLTTLVGGPGGGVVERDGSGYRVLA